MASIGAQGTGSALVPEVRAPIRIETRLPLRLPGAGLPEAIAPVLGLREDSLRRTPKGAFYDDLIVGTGALVQSGDSIAVHFVGYLANGTPVTRSLETPFRVRLGAGQVIEGWEDGLPGMRVGGRRMLVLPAALGYGAKGSGPIPPNATLVFEVVLVERR